jgi:general secretion pathway protein K
MGFGEAARVAMSAGQGQPVPARGRNRAERGFALLIVLGTLVLLALLVTQLTAAGRIEARIAANLRGGAAAESAADGAVYATLFNLLAGGAQGLLAGGMMLRQAIPNGIVEIRVQNEAGKVNPNAASPTLLAALLRAVGADPAPAAAIAAAMTEWRTPGLGGQDAAAVANQYREAGLDYAPPGAPFQSLGEIGLVRGMTAELLARLRPHLTLYSEHGILAAVADPVVRRAVQEAIAAVPGSVESMPAAGTSAVEITAAVQRSDGARFSRYAVVRLREGRDRRPYQILIWAAAPP